MASEGEGAGAPTEWEYTGGRTHKTVLNFKVFCQKSRQVSAIIL